MPQRPVKKRRKRKKSAFVRDIEVFLGACALIVKDKRFLIGLAVVVVLAVGGFATYKALTYKNAYEVFIDDKSIGFIPINKTITEDELLNTAKAKIEATFKSKTTILVNEKLKLNPVHAKKDSMFESNNIISVITEHLTYKVSAIVVSVDGVEKIILKDENEWKTVSENLKRPYLQEGLNIISSDFVENVTWVERHVEPSEIMTADKAYSILNQTTQAEHVVKVASGDSLWKIANDNGMTIEQVRELNPGISANLRVGQEIMLSVPKPLLSVKTVEESSQPSVILKEVERRVNPDYGKSYSRVIQQGSNGEERVTVNIIRVNGIETERVTISREIIVPVKNDIIEVGS